MSKPQPIRVVYFGTPTYAVPALGALAADPRYEVVLIVTQPDRPAGRGNRVSPSPVKTCAGELGIPVYQPASLRDESARRPLAEARADLFVVAAYGLIFGARTLALPRFGCLNLHASLLPAYRGASPVAAAILSGDAVTGVSLMVMEQGLDTGPVVDRITVPILSSDTTESLTATLAEAAAALVVPSAEAYFRGARLAEPQDGSHATLVRQLVKADGWIDWGASAVELDRHVRAMWAWPRAWTTFREEPLQIHAAAPLQEKLGALPGSLIVDDLALRVACGVGSLRLITVQPAAAKPMPGLAWAIGKRLRPGDRLGLVGAPSPLPPLITKA